MERISQRKYDFDSIEDFIRWKGYPESISDRGKSLTSGMVRIHIYFFLYNTLLSVTCFFKICGLPKAGRLLKTFPLHLEWQNFSKCEYKKIINLDKLTGICFANRRR